MPKKKKLTPNASRGGSPLSPLARKHIRARLLRWYDKEKRDLPWRGEKEPYRIWVSETMLQQTRAGAVGPRYESFLARFPTVCALADAPLEAVLAEWQGMGYYGRARRLHRAARILTEKNGGSLPEDPAALRALPGVGPYMAGALASIAFGQRAAAVDGNVVRVLARLIHLKEPVDGAPGRALLDSEAEALVPPSRPGDFNQALMDLGSGVCLPRRPRCHLCPLNECCAARRADEAHLLPVKKKKEPPRPVTMFQFLALRGEALLLVRRKEEGLFGGLWELPGWMDEGHHHAPAPDALKERCRELLGCAWRPTREIARIRRTLTHRKILFVIYGASKTKKGVEAQDEGALWAAAHDLAALPISTAQRTAIRAAREALDNGKGEPAG